MSMELERDGVFAELVDESIVNGGDEEGAEGSVNGVELFVVAKILCVTVAFDEIRRWMG
jgi:hypothetical protein